MISKGSCQEVMVWIDFAQDLGFVGSDVAQDWNDKYVEISKMLYALIKKL